MPRGRRVPRGAEMARVGLEEVWRELGRAGYVRLYGYAHPHCEWLRRARCAGGGWGMSEHKKQLEELLQKLVETINGIEDEKDRSAALLIALGRLLGDVEVALVTRAGVIRLLDVALDEMIRFHYRASESSTLIM